MSAGGKTSKDVRGKRLELPAGFEACLKSFEMVDRAMCFLIKNRVSPTLERVCQFIEDILHSTNQGMFIVSSACFFLVTSSSHSQ
jgi:hypothetical protein